MSARTEHATIVKTQRNNKNHPNKHLTTPHPETGTRGVARKKG